MSGVALRISPPGGMRAAPRHEVESCTRTIDSSIVRRTRSNWCSVGAIDYQPACSRAMAGFSSDYLRCVVVAIETERCQKVSCFDRAFSKQARLSGARNVTSSFVHGRNVGCL
jgi:hypothetical protein